MEYPDKELEAMMPGAFLPKTNEKNEPEYAFSVSDWGAVWHESIQDAVEEMLGYNGDDRTLYMGTIRRPTHSDFIDAESILDNVLECAYDEAGEYIDTYLEDIPKEKIADLQFVISDWMDANIPKPNFYIVENIVQIEVAVDTSGKYVSHSVRWVVGTEEGETCGRNGCTGILGYPPVKNCTCHLNPPCAACVDNPLACPECGWIEGEE